MRLPFLRPQSLLRTQFIPVQLSSRISSHYPMGAKKMSTDSGEPLPPLSANDFRTYNRMSEQMEAFVSPPLFRFTFDQGN
jgi:hypothetical protein